MVLLGGLEIVAAGLLLNEFNKDKVEARERRKQERLHHNGDEYRPGHDRPHHHHSHSNLAPPSQPLRPLSAPPDNSGGGPWHNRPLAPPSGYPVVPPQQWHPSGPPHQPGPNLARPPPPYPGPANGPYAQHSINMSHQQLPQQISGPGFPRPGPMQHAATFHPPSQQMQPNARPVQSSQTFPVMNQQQMSQPNLAQASGKPPPAGPLTYVDTKTGRVSHNLYPPDHPMARSVGQPDMQLGPDMWGNRVRSRSSAADGHSGLRWSESDENDLAYGKDYSDGRRGRPREW